MTEPDAGHADGAAGFWLVKLALLLLAGGLAYAIGTLPPSPGLGGAVRDALPASGVANDVTAVLLNFRAYDTLLEVTVLFLALLGMRTLVTPGGATGDPGPVLRALAMLLIPFLIVFAGYLLWAGAHEPGGAFQAGTLLAAGGVLSSLAGYSWVIALPDFRLRALVLIGPVVFAGTGVGAMLAGRRFIELSPDWAGVLILLIEAAAAVSIGMSLLAAFHSVMGSVEGEVS